MSMPSFIEIVCKQCPREEIQWGDRQTQEGIIQDSVALLTDLENKHLCKILTETNFI